MSGTLTGRPADRSNGADTLLHGWGRTAPTRAHVTAVTSVDELAALVTGAGPRGVLARGLGRSYGDAAQNAGGAVADLTGLTGIHAFDEVAGTVDVDAGLSLHDLLRRTVPAGWFVAVSPGTRYVTVGGAIASDIHGKNHHVEGSFCQHVEAMSLLAADGSVRELRPTGETAEAFWATAGGMGLTGIVVRATLRLLRIETAQVLVDTERASDLDDVMARMIAGDDAYRYSVAWVDTLARGASMGRSVLTRGDHAAASASAAPVTYDPRPRVSAPPWVPDGLLNRLTVRAFNELWYRKAPRSHTGLESIPTFFHPLDGVGGWNGIYGRPGFIQYQYVVPDAAAEVVRATIELVSGHRCPSFLAVLKRFGPGSPGPLSFPQPGWTLALDIPAGMPGLATLCDRLDALVVAAGGRVYLSKDSRLRPDVLAAMYPRLDEWRGVRASLDPGGVFRSDLSRRLGLA